MFTIVIHNIRSHTRTFHYFSLSFFIYRLNRISPTSYICLTSATHCACVHFSIVTRQLTYISCEERDMRAKITTDGLSREHVVTRETVFSHIVHIRLVVLIMQPISTYMFTIIGLVFRVNIRHFALVRLEHQINCN